MADLNAFAQGTAITLGVNRYILGTMDPARANIVTAQIDLNGGTCTVVPQVRVKPQTTWQAAQVFPVSAPTTGSASLTGSDVYRLDATGVEVAFNCTAVTGSPIFSWFSVTG